VRDRARVLLAVVVFAVSVTACLPTDPAPNDPSGCAYAPLIRSVWGPDADQAIAIAWRESRCQPDAYNPSGSAGLFQLMMPLHADLFTAVGCPADAWADARCNVLAAHALFEAAGWGPWAL
jgi:hypothetical protein